jgi:hypothetical protein
MSSAAAAAALAGSRGVSIKTALDNTLRQAMARVSFRDVLLSSEAKGRSGARQYLALPGLTRTMAAREIVRLFGANRVCSVDAEPRPLQLARATAEGLAAPDLLLTTPIHSVFGRSRSPVSFLLDIDAEHEKAAAVGSSGGGSSAGSVNPAQFEDRVLAFVLHACRVAFHRRQLRARKVALLTASDAAQGYASLHVHVELTDAAFVDSTSIGHFIRGDLAAEIDRLGAVSSQTAAFARVVRQAVDAQPFGAVGGSLRVYGAPKLDGSRPFRLYRPPLGGATAMALHALAPTEGGPTMRLLRCPAMLPPSVSAASAAAPVLKRIALDGAVGGRAATADDVGAAFSSAIGSQLLLFEQQLDERRRRPLGDDDAAAQPRTLAVDELLVPAHGIPVLRDVELEALEMSLGTPDYLAPAPFRFVAVAAPARSNVASSVPASGPAAQLSSTGDETIPGRGIRIVTVAWPEAVRNEIKDRTDAIPYPRQGASPATYAFVAAAVAPAIPAAFARPYRTWVSVGLALTDIAEYAREDEDASPNLYAAFIAFSRQAPNFDQGACRRLWEKMMRAKKFRTREPLNAVTVHQAYSAMVGLFKKPAP